MSWWVRFHNWLFDRQARRMLHASVDAVLVLAAARLGRELTAREREELPDIWSAWLREDELRMLDLLNRPTWTIHLFLSQIAP